MEKSKELIVLIIALGSLLIIIAIFLVLIYLLYRKKSEAARKRIEKLQQESVISNMEIQEETLNRVAFELHDSVGQNLTFARLSLTSLANKDEQTKQALIQDASNAIHNSIVELRNLSKTMAGDKVTEIGLCKAIENELKFLEQTGNYKINFVNECEPMPLTPQTEIMVFRIVQESLTNIVKHADTSTIDVKVEYGKPFTTITITDAGKGFTPEEVTENGLGLKSMKKRAQLIGGNYTINSTPGVGTKTILKF